MRRAVRRAVPTAAVTPALGMSRQWRGNEGHRGKRSKPCRLEALRVKVNGGTGCRLWLLEDGRAQEKTVRLPKAEA